MSRELMLHDWAVPPLKLFFLVHGKTEHIQFFSPSHVHQQAQEVSVIILETGCLGFVGAGSENVVSCVHLDHYEKCGFLHLSLRQHTGAEPHGVVFQHFTSEAGLQALERGYNRAWGRWRQEVQRKSSACPFKSCSIKEKKGQNLTLCHLHIVPTSDGLCTRHRKSRTETHSNTEPSVSECSEMHTCQTQVDVPNTWIWNPPSQELCPFWILILRT